MWTALIPIIAQYGLPLAESLFTKWSSGAQPTAQDFQDLRTLASKKGSDEMLDVLKAQGIDPTSAQGKALLALVS